MERKRDRFGYAVIKYIALLFLLGTIALVCLFSANLASPLPSHTLDQASTSATNGAQQWNGNAKVTLPIMKFAPPTGATLGVSPLFASTYQRYKTATANSLGVPVTVAFPTAYGWLQFFTAGALLLPAASHPSIQQTKDALAQLVSHGVRDPLTGVLRLPLLPDLLTSGSPLPLAGNGSSLTYIDLRKAADPARMQFAPPVNSPATVQTSVSVAHLSDARQAQEIFIQTGVRTGKAVGHLIPAAVWTYLHQPGIAPNGWEHDFGLPLTSALSFTLPVNAQTHHMLIQAFALDAVILDHDALQATPNAQPKPVESPRSIQTGIDYLRTHGLPSVVVQPQQQAWVQNDTTLFDAAGTGKILAHVGQNFPLILPGVTSWIGNMLWYRVQWSQPKSTQSGWVSGAALTFQSPGDKPAFAFFDALSPSLAAYLAQQDATTGAVVYDVTHQRTYSYNGSMPFLAASSIKVPIMLTFLDMIEQQGREPDGNEMNLLVTMIENSNNDSASALYFNTINGSQGINRYMQKIGVSGLSPDDDAWGYSTITPQAMVNLLTLLQGGKTLNSAHRALALNLMENVEPDQQVGVGDTAPPNARVALKDGWVTGPDNYWAVNSSGIVSVSNKTYIVSVYTQQQPSLESGQTIARTLCNNVASLLTS